MTIRVEEYTPAHAPAVREFIESLWVRHDSRFYPWRFDRWPGIRMLLALDGDVCAAMVSVVHRPYLVRGEQRLVGEIFDWATATAYQGKGLGRALVQRLMDEGQPLLVLGGTEYTVAILPKMKWRRLPDVTVCGLPLAGSFIRERLHSRGAAISRVGGAAFDAAGKYWFHAPRARRHKELRAVPLTALDDGILDLYQSARAQSAPSAGAARAATATQLLTLPSPVEYAWMGPGLPRHGAYLPFVVLDGDTRVAWGAGRVIASHGHLRGEIIDLYAREPDPAVYAFAAGYISRVLASFGVDAVVAGTTSPLVQSALKAQRFVAAATVPLQLWWAEPAPPPETCQIMRSIADGAVLPYPL